VQTPVLGVVENMSGYVCPTCHTEDAIFGRGGAAALAERFRVPLLARLPIVPAVREAGDSGRPPVAAGPAHPPRETLRWLARAVPDRVRDAAARSTLGASI